MERIFLGQAVTGQDIDKLKIELEKIFSLFNERGYDYFCTLDEKNESIEKLSKKGIFDKAFKEIDNSNIFLVIIRNENKSDGLLMELGYVLSKGMKIFLIINKEVQNTYIREVANKFMDYDGTEKDLLIKLNEILD